VTLRDALEIWLYSEGPSPKGGIQLETLGWTITRDKERAFTIPMLMFSSDVISHRYTIRIHKESVSTRYHGHPCIVKAADPKFFEKISRLMTHAINAHACSDCGRIRGGVSPIDVSP
jgi:hypothetical protein